MYTEFYPLAVPAEQPIQKFDRKFREEFNACGQLPVVAILGRDDFFELAGAIRLLFGLDLKEGNPDELKEVQTFEYQGIRIFCSHAIQRGMMFAGVERK